MKFIIAASVVSMILVTARFLPVMGAKEEPEEDMLTHHVTFSNAYKAPVVEELFSLIGPDDLFPLCSKMAAYYDRYNKRTPTFNAWGGKKRAFPGSLTHPYGKRNSNSNFNPWGGKRSEAVDADYTLNSDDKNAAAAAGAHV